MRIQRFFQNVNLFQGWRVLAYATPYIVYNIIKKAQQGGE